VDDRNFHLAALAVSLVVIDHIDDGLKSETFSKTPTRWPNCGCRGRLFLALLTGRVRSNVELPLIRLMVLRRSFMLLSIHVCLPADAGQTPALIVGPVLMTVEPLGALVLLLGMMSLARGPAFAFYVFIPCTLLGSAAVFTLQTLSIQPAHLFLAFMVIVVFSRRDLLASASQSVSYPLPGFWLLCTACYGVFGAIVFPRALGGITQINAIGLTTTYSTIPLQPTSGNLTQSIYFCADVVCFLLCSAFASTLAGFRAVFGALLVYCAGNILFAALDLATFWTGTAYLLGFIRNSTYVLQTDTLVLGLKRIIGSFTEASQFASTTMGALGFVARLWLFGIMPSVTFPITIIFFLLVLFSTSSTAYAALPPLICYLYAGATFKILQKNASFASILFIFILPLAAMIAVLAIMLVPSASSAVNAFLGVLIFDKSTSQSGIERGFLNSNGLLNFVQTFGLGAGIGSVRTSSFPIAVLANLGVIGAASYALFLIKIFFVASKADMSIEWQISTAARAACFGLFCAAIVSGTLIDLGLPFFIFAGLSAAKPKRMFVPTRVPEASLRPREVPG
jgi:hypothetical protein